MNKSLILLLLLLTSCHSGVALGQPSKSNVNVVFVVDSSGSMDDNNKMEATRNALQRSIDLLPDNANVGILEFAGFTTWIVPIGEMNRQEISKQIQGISSSGATAIGNAMQEASTALIAHRDHFPGNKETATFQIVLMTDGQNSRGRDPLEVIPQVKQNGQRLDVIGIEFHDEGILGALTQSGFESGYHDVAQVEQLFTVLKEVLNIETVTSTNGIDDFDLIASVPVDVAQACVSAIVTASKAPADTAYEPSTQSAPTQSGGSSSNPQPRSNGCSLGGVGSSSTTLHEMLIIVTVIGLIALLIKMLRDMVMFWKLIRKSQQPPEPKPPPED